MNVSVKVLLVNVCLIIVGMFSTLSLYSQDNDNLFSKPRRRYIITDTIDCNGHSVVFPKRSKIIFKGGIITNAKLTFNKTKIISDNICFGENIHFDGSIRNDISFEWFDIKFNQKLDNSSAINSALCLASLSPSKLFKLALNEHVYVNAHQDDFVKRNGIEYITNGNIRVPSGVTFDLNGSTIHALPNDCPQYAVVFSADTENVVICNGVISGDADNHIFNKGTHEWGYGIELQGVKNFLIKDIVCENCTGDGIDIQAFLDFDNSGKLQHIINCRNGMILNSHCRNNGRNSMSIQGCDTLFVDNCSFETAKRTAPKAGVDIEPSISKGIVSNVIFKDCKFNNNGAYGLLIHKIAETVCINKIRIIQSSFFSDDASYHILNNGAEGLDIENCAFLSTVNTGYHIRNTNTSNVLINSCHSVSSGVRIQFDGIIENLNVSDTQLSSFKIIRYPDKETRVKINVYSCDIIPDNDVYALFEHSPNPNSLDVTFEKCTFDYSKSVFRNPQNNVFLIGNNSDVRYLFDMCKFIGNGANMNITNSLHLKNSYIQNVRLNIVLKENIPNNIVFTKNTIDGFYIYPNNTAIKLVNSSITSPAYINLSDNSFITQSADPISLFYFNAVRNIQIESNNTNLKFKSKSIVE